MKIIKLTDYNNTIYNENYIFNSEEYAYPNINLALILNVLHNSYSEFKIWESEGNILLNNWDRLKCSSLKLLYQLNTPQWYKDKNIRYNVYLKFIEIASIKVFEKYNDFLEENMKNRFLKLKELILNLNDNFYSDSPYQRGGYIYEYCNTKQKIIKFLNISIHDVYNAYELYHINKNNLIFEKAETIFILYISLFCLFNKYSLDRYIIYICESLYHLKINYLEILNKIIDEVNNASYT